MAYMNLPDLPISKFGKTFQRLRHSKGVSLGDMAKVLGCSLPHIGDLEYGQIKPTKREIEVIALRLGVPVKDIVS